MSKKTGPHEQKKNKVVRKRHESSGNTLNVTKSGKYEVETGIVLRVRQRGKNGKSLTNHRFVQHEEARQL